MKTTLSKNRAICIVVKINSRFSEKFRFKKAICRDAFTAKKWLEKNFGTLTDQIEKNKHFRFFTLADGIFAKLPNREVLDIINGKLI